VGGFGALFSVTLLGMAGSPDNFKDPGMAGWAAAVGFVYLLVSAGQIVFAYAGWQMRRWAWPVGVSVAIAWGVANAVAFGASLITAIVGPGCMIVILYYLFLPHVKAAFGR